LAAIKILERLYCPYKQRWYYDPMTGGTMRTIRFAIAILAAIIPAAAADRGEEVKLWTNGAPGSEGVTAAEISKPATATSKFPGLPSNFTLVHYPSIYVFLPPREKATGAAMIVAPGGGNTQLVIDKEGWEMAGWLNSIGIAAFVLKYRLAKAPGVTYTLPGEVYADAARAVRLVRSRAEEWHVDPKRVGFAGFSAGGQVTGMIETKFDAGKPGASDAVERQSSRPDFTVLIYPGARPDGFPVPNDAPPAFLVCADDDRSHVEVTAKFYLELEAAHIPSELHIYTYGGHGFGLRPTKNHGPVETWPDRLKEWLADRGFSKQ
jgi:endo-1,4-beta-xylanase